MPSSLTHLTLRMQCISIPATVAYIVVRALAFISKPVIAISPRLSSIVESLLTTIKIQRRLLLFRVIKRRIHLRNMQVVPFETVNQMTLVVVKDFK